jgi:hypothetical protein
MSGHGGGHSDTSRPWMESEKKKKTSIGKGKRKKRQLSMHEKEVKSGR